MGDAPRILEGHGARVYSLAYSPAGDMLVSGGADKKIKFWRLIDRPVEDGERRRRRQLIQALDDDRFEVRQEAFRRLADLGRVVESDLHRAMQQPPSAEMRLRLRRLLAILAVPPGVGHEGDVRSVAFSPAGDVVASASRDNSVRLWKSATGRSFRALKAHTDGAWSVSFSPDGNVLVSAGGDQQIRLWDVKTGRVLAALTGHESTIHRAVFLPDGRTLASAGSFDRTARLWDVATRRCRATLAAHADAVLSVAFSPDGRTVASTGYDGVIHLWRSASGDHLDAIRTETGPLRCLAFSPDGRLLATGGDDGRVRLWKWGTGQMATVLGGGEGAVCCLGFSPDARELATAGHDGKIRRWPIPEAVGQSEVATRPG